MHIYSSFTLHIYSSFTLHIQPFYTSFTSEIYSSFTLHILTLLHLSPHTFTLLLPFTFNHLFYLAHLFILHSLYLSHLPIHLTPVPVHKRECYKQTLPACAIYFLVTKNDIDFTFTFRIFTSTELFVHLTLESMSEYFPVGHLIITHFTYFHSQN